MLTAGDVSAATHHYRVAFAADSTEIAIEGRLARGGLALSAAQAASASIRQLATCAGLPLRAARRVKLSAEHDCLTYRVSPKPDSSARWRPLSNQARLYKLSSWLLLPELQLDDEVIVTLEQPTDLQLSVPWVEMDATYRIAPSPRSSEGFVVAGTFAELDLSAAGVTKPGAYIGPAEHAAKISTWLAAQIAGVQRTFGRFPNPHAQIIAVAVESTSGRSPVPFGHVIRDQGETIQFFVDPRRTLQDLLKDWTAAHELAHLALPYVQDKWVAEGFASYYQNLLQARGGYYSEREAWARLTRSFANAARDGRNMSPNETRRYDFWRARMMIYWSGASMALHADVALRKASANEESLDDVLSKYAACCLPGRRAWRARDLFRALDGLTDHPVFVDLHNKYANAKGMPPTEALFAALGVAGTGESVQLQDDAPLAHVRRAIMSTPPAQ